MTPKLSEDAFFTPVPPVRTQRLLFRPYAQADFAALADLHGREAVVRFLPWPRHASAADTQELIDERLGMHSLSRDGQKLVWAIEETETRRVVGDIALVLVQRAGRQGEIGFIIHPDRQRRGYALEAAAAMLELGFRHAGFHRLTGRCDARNTASAGVMRRLGMREEGHFRQSEFRHGAWVDMKLFALLAEEWQGTTAFA